jgi:rhamnose transport system substrate-binding protein
MEVFVKMRVFRRLITFGAASAVGLTSLSPAAAQDKQYSIGFVPKLINVGYFNAMQQGADEAAKKFGVKFVYNGPTTADANLQVQAIKQFIAQHVDAIAVAPDDPAVVAPALAQAEAQGIKVFTSDTDAPASSRLVFVNQALNTAIGNAVLDSLADQMGKTGEWAIDSCGPAAQNLNGWIAIEKERAAKYPGMKFVGVVYSGEDQAKAVSDTRDLITAHPNLKGVIGQCTTSGPGAAQAITELNKIGKVFVTGVALPSGMKPYIANGACKSFVLWDPVKLGYLTLWAGAQLAAGKSFQASNDVPGLGKIAYDASKKMLLLGPPTVFTKANINQYSF